MEKQKKNEAGITLVALVVSIIVMLVLAGVSLNATVGENGIITRAQEAALQHKIATDLEELNLELAKINVDTISTDETMAIQDVASYLVAQGAIDSFVTTSAGQIAAGIDTATGNKYFFGTKGDNTYRITRKTDGLLSAELTTYTSGGDITGGYALVTADSFNSDDSLPATEKGKFTITDDAEVVFMDSISGALSIYVADNVHATVGIYDDMTLTNQGVKRSAIDISKNNGVLDLYVGDGVEVTVNSGLGEDASGNIAGKGGYAGIHVPEGAVLNIHGSGIVTAIGGNAGNGYVGGSLQAGGGGAGAGIGGNGGAGGAGADGISVDSYRAAENGGNGENCGIVKIFDTPTIYAYGGGGGAGGASTDGCGGGAGGYPGAGIGGGGAGGAGATCCTGAGGYSGGVGGSSNENLISQNGLRGDYSHRCTAFWGGGGYFQPGEDYDINNEAIPCLGGFGGTSWWRGHRGGDGGTAGSGGNIYVNNTSNDNKAIVYAFNGNMYTDSNTNSEHAYGNGLNQCPIYLQSGIKIAQYDVESWGNHNSYKDVLGDTNQITMKVVSDQSSVSLNSNKYVNSMYETNNDFKNNKTININTKINITTNNVLTAVDMSKQGVGSGAGYVEVSNGTYNLCTQSGTTLTAQ